MIKNKMNVNMLVFGIFLSILFTYHVVQAFSYSSPVCIGITDDIGGHPQLEFRNGLLYVVDNWVGDDSQVIMVSPITGATYTFTQI